MAKWSGRQTSKRNSWVQSCPDHKLDLSYGNSEPQYPPTMLVNNQLVSLLLAGILNKFVMLVFVFTVAPISIAQLNTLVHK